MNKELLTLEALVILIDTYESNKRMIKHILSRAKGGLCDCMFVNVCVGSLCLRGPWRLGSSSRYRFALAPFLLLPGMSLQFM